MNPVTTDIKDYLLANTSLVFGVDLFIGAIPAQKSGDILILFDTSGAPPERHGIRNPTLQILCRAGGIGRYLEAYSKLETVCELLHEKTNEVINGTRYIQILKISDLFLVGEDKKKRDLFSCNFLIQRT